MTTLSVSASGTASLSQLINDPPKSFATPVVVGDGSVNTKSVSGTTTEQAKPAIIRPVTPDDLLDSEAQQAGRFLDITA